MAEITGASGVFTNGSAQTDLLQRAFRQVVDDDEERESDLVAFLQSPDDAEEHQTIHLTAEQAAALGLTFEVASGEEVMFRAAQVQDGELTGIRESISEKDNESSQESSLPQDSISLNQLNFQSNDQSDKTAVEGMIKTECIDFQEWHMQKADHGEEMQEDDMQKDLALEGITLHDQSNGSQQVAEQSRSVQQEAQTILLDPSVHTIKTDVTSVKNISENGLHYTVGNGLAQLGSITNSQAQILQKLPVILPSSQFIIKPAQTILKPAKNIRLLQSSNKIASSGGNSVHTINGSGNSVLLSKIGVNTLSPQIIKATPITAQILSSNGLSQLLNTSQVLTGTCEMGQNVAQHISNSAVNTTSSSTQNVVTSQIRLSPVVKTAQKGGVQQFLTPILKTSTMPKSAPVLNTSNVTTIPTQFLKSVQIPAQILKTSAAVVGKKGVITAAPKSAVNTNSPIVLRTASIVKAQDLKAITSNSASILKPTQVSTTPISILKPQTKIAFNNSPKQNVTVTSQSIGNCVNSVQKIAVSRQNSTFESAKPIQNGSNGIKPKTNLTMNGTNLRITKKVKAVPTKPATIVPESTDTSKPLGSSENPIQIVQQGQTFHSMQRLTQTQLKQIAQVLQQRSQEAAMPNERVVYRVVFPEELDLRFRNPGNLLKNRGGKRGRPKKNAIRPPLLPPKPPPAPEEEQEETKDERKKVVARTRSGRLSRPPRHMVRDYKHIHHLDFLQPDLDDSDGGYSDYNTNNEKIEDEESPKELLSGLEVPKRKISDHFRCPTCNKIYLGRTRMARHFEMHPDHGSPEQLPPPTAEPELKQNNGQDPLKRKGKKRGPWAYVTPEAKSERRQIKLKEAISVCDDSEIVKIAAKPVLNAQSLFDLLVLKSENNVRNFLSELKQLLEKVKERASMMLTTVGNAKDSDFIEINEEQLCDALGIAPGVYRVNDKALQKVDQQVSDVYNSEEPPHKLQKTENNEEGKENAEERLSSGLSESSDLSVSDFLSERRNDVANPTCPEVLSALTLMRRNPSPSSSAEGTKTNSVSKLLISNPEIQSQISESPGFQKVDINASKSFQKPESQEESFPKLGDALDSSGCSQVFCKVENEYEQSKMEQIEQAFIKLEPVDQGFIKLENGALGSYQKQDIQSFEKMQNGLDSIEGGSQSFAKGFQKLVSKIIPMTSSELSCMKTSSLDIESCKAISATSSCKMSDSMPMLQDTVPIISTSCDGNIFGSTENLDMSKITQYDHITHLDILNTSGVIDKNLLIDEKLVEQLQLVDQSNLVDELVSERLKNIMPDNILENNLMPNNSNLDTDLDFDALSEEFNRNTRS